MPFKEQIEYILNTNQRTNHLSNLNLYDKLEVFKNLSWMSKFAFDKDYLSFYQKNRFLYNFTQDKYLKSTQILETYKESFSDSVVLHQFLKKYPCLPSLLKLFIAHTNNYINEILKSYSLDKKHLSYLFNNGENLGDIVTVNLGLGDVHQQGKTTAILHLSNGKKIVYKPRSGGLDIAFNSVLKVVNGNVNAIHLKETKIYDRKQYHWAEYIEYLPCKSLNELKMYYKNCGALIGLIYLLRGTDMHFENIIAHGKHPVLIDLECLFSSVHFGKYNILNTGFIPTKSSINNGDNYFDASGLGANEKQLATTKKWKWKNLNSDLLTLEKGSGFFVAKHNQPILNENKIPPKEYLNEILEGFENICKWVMQSKNEFYRFNPFKVFKDKTIRIIPRLTQEYKDILENSFIPMALSSHKKRTSVIVKYLKKYPMLLSLSSTQKEILLSYELKAIKRLDIPYFTANTSKNFLMESKYIVLNKFHKETPYDVVMKKINSLHQDEINEQISLIKSTFVSRYGLGIKFSKKCISAKQLL